MRDGFEPLHVASRFGRFVLPWQVCQHADGTHCLPSNRVLPEHHGLLITRGLQEWACLLPGDLPAGTAQRLLGWRTHEPKILSESELRQLVCRHGQLIRAAEAAVADRCFDQLWGKDRTGQPGAGTALPAPGKEALPEVRLVPAGETRGRAAWPADLDAAVTTALAQPHPEPPEGVSRADWARVLAVRREECAERKEPEAQPALPPRTPRQLARLGPQVGPEEVVVAVDEVLVRRRERRQWWEHRTARVATAAGHRYLSGTGESFLKQLLVLLALCGGWQWPVTVLSDGAEWLRLWLPELTQRLAMVRWVLDWFHLRRKVYQRASEMGRTREERRALTRELLRPLRRGQVEAACECLHGWAGTTRSETARAQLREYLQERKEAIPAYRERRERRQYIGSGWAEKANDLLVARRQKRKGMHWSQEMSVGLVALKTLILNEEWEAYWQGTWQPLGICPNACAR